MKLDVKLFGTPRILVDGHEATLPYKKADAVLYYVILKGSATRIRLSELLWPDAPAETGLKNLRHAIYSIRKALDGNPFYEQQRSTLTISPEVSVVCDALDFINSGDTDLYSGELLEGLSIPSADTFESWIQEERIQLQNQYLDRLLAVAQDALAHGEPKIAEQCCLRYMQTDRTEENNVILLMRVYRTQHQFLKAIELYQALCKTLANEYGIAPLSETTELYYEILSEWNASADEAADNSECLLLGKDAAIGRLLELCNGMRRSPHNRCVLLEGEAGVGKTCLLDWVMKSCDLSGRLICRDTCYQSEAERFLAPWSSVIFALISELEMRGMPFPAKHAKAASALFPALLLSQVIGSLEESKKPAALASGMKNIIGYRLASLMEDERRVLELVSVFIGSAPFDALSSILKKASWNKPISAAN